MKGVVHAGGGRFEVVEAPDPAPGPDELVLRVTACGICGSDLKAAAMMPAGTVMGHEFCGRVVAAGAEVRDRWPEGRLVSSMPLRSCGRCRWCLTGEVAHCEAVDYLGLGAAAGAFAEYVKVSAPVSFALPDAVGERGALIEPLAVGLHAVTAAGLQPGSRVLVMGGGAVGAAVLVWAARLGAAEIMVSDPSPARREAAARIGATSVHDPADGPPASTYDVVVECVGGPGMVQAAMDGACTRGRVVVAGVCTTPDPIHHLPALMKEVDVRYAVYYTRQEFDLAARMLAGGQLDVEPLIAGRIGIDGFDATFSALARHELEGKYLVEP